MSAATAIRACFIRFSLTLFYDGSTFVVEIGSGGTNDSYSASEVSEVLSLD